jgi:hypothetical protein
MYVPLIASNEKKKDSAIISFLLFALLFIIIFALSIFIKKKAIIAEQPILLIKCEINCIFIS